MNFKYVKHGRDMENEMNYGSEKAFPGIPIEYEGKSSHADKLNPRYMEATVPGVDKISLFQAIEEAVAQADKLADMLMELTGRLVPVRRESNEVDVADDFKMNVARPRPNYGSPLAARVTTISDVIKASQERIARTMDELDL